MAKQSFARAIDLRTRRLRTTTRLVLGVAGVPSAALLTLGIIVLASGSATRDVVFGVLIIGMAATVATGVVVSTILLAREAELARLQSEFVQRVSHDLRTPLTSIKLFVETLQMGRAPDPNTTRECLDALGTETERMLALVERLLDWARIESARRMYESQRTQVHEIIDAALLAFEPLRVQGKVKLTRTLAEGLPELEVDRAALVDALINLLQNAYHYSPAEKVIGVTARVKDDKLEISVSDNGIGVPPAERAMIFERFYRGESARAAGISGTGLGLAMARAVVTAHRGTLRVDDNVPVGSVFTITLPLTGRPR